MHVTQSYTWIGVDRQGLPYGFFGSEHVCGRRRFGVNTYQCCAYGKGNIAYQYIPSASKAKNLKINYKKIIVFNIVLFLKMNEQDGESGANRWETEQEKICKKQEGKNAVQVDLRMDV